MKINNIQDFQSDLEITPSIHKENDYDYGISEENFQDGPSKISKRSPRRKKRQMMDPLMDSGKTKLAFSIATISRYLKYGIYNLSPERRQQLESVLDGIGDYKDILEDKQSYNVLDTDPDAETVHIKINVDKLYKKILNYQDYSFFREPQNYLHNFEYRWQMLYKQKCTFTFKDIKASSVPSFDGDYAASMEKYVTLQGRVRRKTDLNCAIVSSVYKCTNCANEIIVDRMWYDPMKEAGKDAPCICGQKNPMELVELPQKRVKESWRTITIQEQKQQQGSQFATMKNIDCRVLDKVDSDLLVVGDIVVIRGILKSEIGPKAKSKPYIDCYGISQIIEKNASPTMGKTQYEYFKSLPFNQLWKKISQSVFKNIHGLQIIKKALILQAVKGSNNNKRNNIHIGVFGNPGLGKSQLIKSVSRVFKGVYCVGNNITVPGLTATVYRDKDNEWNLDGGAVIQANRGFLFLDEIDKLKPDVLDALLEPMEQQHVSISKAGINVTLPAMISVLCVGNAKDSKLINIKSTVPVKEQISLNQAFWSRLDLKFVVTEQTIGVQESGVILDNVFNPVNATPSQEDKDIIEYIKYASKATNPTLPEQIKREIGKFYKEISSVSELKLGPRDMEALVRLVQSKAKLSMRETPLQEDWVFIKEIYEYAMRPFLKKKKYEPTILQETAHLGKRRTISNELLQVLAENKNRKNNQLMNIFNQKYNYEYEVGQFTMLLYNLEQMGLVYKPNGVDYTSIR